MKNKIPYALKLSTVTKQRLKNFCDERGRLQAHFVEQAIVEKMDREELFEDALEFKRLEHEVPYRISLDAYMKERGKQRTKAS